MNINNDFEKIAACFYQQAEWMKESIAYSPGVYESDDDRLLHDHVDPELYLDKLESMHVLLSHMDDVVANMSNSFYNKTFQDCKVIFNESNVTHNIY